MQAARPAEAARPEDLRDSSRKSRGVIGLWNNWPPLLLLANARQSSMSDTLGQVTRYRNLSERRSIGNVPQAPAGQFTEVSCCCCFTLVARSREPKLNAGSGAEGRERSLMPRKSRRALWSDAACYHILNRGHARET